MKKFRSENGVITMITLITVLVTVSLLITSYILIANKVRAQKEIVDETRRIYEPTSSMEEIYNSYFNNENIVPIYTVEQLQAIGTGEIINIDGKYYTFSNNENTVYVLMNNLEFNAYEKYGEEYYWKPIGNREDLLCNFEGKNNIIQVNYKEYNKVYSKDNRFSEYEIVVINPVPEDAIVTISSNGEVIAAGQGRQRVLVDPGANIEYLVKKTYYQSKTQSITVDSTIISTVELELKPEQTLILPNASSIEAEDWSNVKDADDGIDSEDYAYSWNTDKFYLHYDVSALNEDVKITNIIARYRLKQTISNNDVVVILNAGDVECINTTVENISTKSKGTVYESIASVLPTGADVKKGLTLSINNTDGGVDLLYIYGSELEIKYIEP